MPLIQQAVFFTTVAHLRDLPTETISEVAFAGRSNAGKSSAINALVGHNRLAFVSKTPGRTQHLNYFTVGQGRFLVDLPGYGYAKAPEAIRRQWEGLVGPYLSRRETLAGLVLVMDCRHPLTVLDWRLINWFAPTMKPVHVLLTKADKLSRQAQSEVLRRVGGQLQEYGNVFSVQLFSSLKKTGVEEARSVINTWFDNPGFIPLAEKETPDRASGAKKS